MSKEQKEIHRFCRCGNDFYTTDPEEVMCVWCRDGGDNWANDPEEGAR